MTPAGQTAEFAAAAGGSEIGLAGQFVYGMLAVLVLIPIAVGMLFWLLRQKDKLLGIDFKDAEYPKIARNPMALSIYFAAWVLSVGHIINGIVGRFI